MSKTVKNHMIRDYKQRLEGVGDAVLLGMRGVGGIDNNKMRIDLQKKQVRVTVIRNNLANHAFKGTGLSALEPLLSGPSAIAYSKESVVDVARAIMEWAGKLEKLELKGAVLDGTLYKGKAGVTELSRFPTRIEAQGNIVGLALGPGRKVLGQVKGPAGKVMGIVKSIEEKLEKGETIAKVG
jgi:large subunit ribosomal protein L10